MFTRRFRNVGGNSVRLCWTLFTSEPFVVNNIKINNSTLSVCFCVFSRHESTCFKLFFSRAPEDLLGSWSAGTSRMCWWCLSAFCFCSRHMEACRTYRWAKCKWSHPVNLKKNPLWRSNIQTTSSTCTVAILHYNSIGGTQIDARPVPQ